MGKVTGFLEIDRRDRRYAPASDRIRHYKEFVIPLSEEATRDQAARCMNCGIPYCHNGCPVNNQIPDWNDLVYHGDWEDALRNLHSTNNFPEFTGRICPAPCEASCTLNLNDASVTIKTIECAIVDRGWNEGWIVPEPSATKTGKKVAVVGSGPAGLAAAQQLGRAGHDVHVYEKHAKAGGLLRYGIPDFKMEKTLIDRRVEQMKAEGIVFHTNVEIGKTKSFKDLSDNYDAVILAGGAEKPRDLPVPGRALHGVHFAMDFLPQQNRRVSHEPLTSNEPILASGKHVVVIGGGDTGNDCIGTSMRHGCKGVINLEIVPEPPTSRATNNPWPQWPRIFRVDYGHAEVEALFGNDPRLFSTTTVEFLGNDKGEVRALKIAKAEPAPPFKIIPGTEQEIPADLVFLALGFLGPESPVAEQLGVKLDGRSNYEATHGNFNTNVPGVFAAGDCRRGQSLIVWAINEGRGAARECDKYLMGKSDLP